ncbi:MAP/microtubule affinity-regulating kinase 3 [Gonapodya sp. JEL0774]|nr:MAP/microtubule affinity-regulating kinase 3 [Gonapodya sp. JEL0774]
MPPRKNKAADNDPEDPETSALDEPPAKKRKSSSKKNAKTDDEPASDPTLVHDAKTSKPKSSQPRSSKKIPHDDAADGAAAGGNTGKTETEDDSHYPRNTAMPASYEFLPAKSSGSVKIVSLNVAGIAAARKKGLDPYVVAENADILCLQEVKLQSPDASLFKEVYPHVLWYVAILETGPDSSDSPVPRSRTLSLPTSKKGYSGSCVLSKLPPLSIRLGVPSSSTSSVTSTSLDQDPDPEGRTITAEFEGFYLVANYVPNAGQKLERLEYKREFARDVRAHLSSLQGLKPVVWTGDLNVAHTPIDLSRPKGNAKTAGFTPEEREDFTTTLSELDLVDAWRHLHPTEKDFTYYSYRFNCRQKHLGWRLDYFVVSRALVDKVSSCEIRNQVYGCSETLSQSSTPPPATSNPTTPYAQLSRRLTKQPSTLSVGMYDFVENLGQGNFAKVKLAIHSLTGQKVPLSPVAVKIISKDKLDPATAKKLFREVRIMKMLNHPHIVKLYEVIDTPKELYLVMEYAPGGEIFDYLVAHGRMKEKDARRTFRQIVSAVSYCHHLHVVHRDLKAENLLLDGSMNVKIADFGFSNQFNPGQKLNTCEKLLLFWVTLLRVIVFDVARCGSPPYAAPELFQGTAYAGPEVDVWSLGVVLYVLICGSLPFDGSTLPALKQRIVNGQYRVPGFMSQGVNGLISSMLVVDSKKRATLADVSRHPWFNEGENEEVVELLNPLTITPDQHKQILADLEEIGVDSLLLEKSLKENVYDHLTATYFLTADRMFGKTGPTKRQRSMELLNDLMSKSTSTGSYGGNDVPQEQQSTAAQRQSLQPAPRTAQPTQSGMGTITEDEVPCEESSDLPPLPFATPPTPELTVPSDVVTRPSGLATMNSANRRATVASSNRPTTSYLPAPPITVPAPSQGPASLPFEATSATSAYIGGSRKARTRAATVNAAQASVPAVRNGRGIDGGGGEHLRSNTDPSAMPNEEAPKTSFAGKLFGRKASAVATVPNDTTTDSQVGQAEPRIMRFALSVNTTSSKDPNAIIAEILRAITQETASEQSVRCVVNGFTVKCRVQDLDFEVEVCRLPLLSSHGLRFKRLGGDSWRYKQICSYLLTKMQL